METSKIILQMIHFRSKNLTWENVPNVYNLFKKVDVSLSFDFPF